VSRFQQPTRTRTALPSPRLSSLVVPSTVALLRCISRSLCSSQCASGLLPNLPTLSRTPARLQYSLKFGGCPFRSTPDTLLSTFGPPANPDFLNHDTLHSKVRLPITIPSPRSATCQSYYFTTSHETQSSHAPPLTTYSLHCICSICRCCAKLSPPYRQSLTAVTLLTCSSITRLPPPSHLTLTVSTITQKSSEL